MDFSFVTAFTIGLLGLVHCVGMCGGIVGTLDAGIGGSSGSGSGGAGRRMAYHLAYNGGRIASYAIAGVLAGMLGALAATASHGNALPIGRLIAGAMMIALGLYLSGWWRIITRLETAGRHLWRLVEPYGQAFLPVRSPLQAFGLGLVWGWLPCGLVYSALALAMASASPAMGAWIMLGFGLGTLPALLSIGAFSGALNAWIRQPLIRQLAGLVIVLFGIYTCVTAFDPPAHHMATGSERPEAAKSLPSRSLSG